MRPGFYRVSSIIAKSYMWRTTQAMEKENRDRKSPCLSSARFVESVVHTISPRGVVMAFLEKIARREKAVLLPMAGKKESHEKDSSVMEANDTPATMGRRVAYTWQQQQKSEQIRKGSREKRRSWGKSHFMQQRNANGHTVMGRTGNRPKKKRTVCFNGTPTVLQSLLPPSKH